MQDTLSKLLTLLPSPPQSVVFVTGGGGTLLHDLLTTPGISAFLLEARVPYSTECVLSTLEEGAPTPSFEAAAAPDGAASSTVSTSKRTRSLCSAEAAEALAMNAIRRCAELWSAAALKDPPDTCPSKPPLLIGIGCSAALTTRRPRRGADRAYINVRAIGCQHIISASVEFTKNRLTRVEQDRILELFVLKALFEFIVDNGRGCNTQEMMRALDDIHEQLAAPRLEWATIHYRKEGEGEGAAKDADTQRVLNVIRGVVNDRYTHAVYFSRAHVLLPNLNLGDLLRHATRATGDYTPSALARFAVLPGSFNPLHEGHTGILRHAVTSLGGNAVPMDTSHMKSAQDMSATPTPGVSKTLPLGLYELSVANADKGTLEPDEVMRRLMQFRGDTDCLVLLSKAPLFFDKAALIDAPTTFLIGVDTFLRLADVGYYKDNATFYRSLAALYFKKINFLVYGRNSAYFSLSPALKRALSVADRKLATPEQEDIFFKADDKSRPMKSSSTDMFVTLEMIRPHLPCYPECLSEFIRDLFLPAGQFRADISSTSIRRTIVASPENLSSLKKQP